jgi:hypothetical protein
VKWCVAAGSAARGNLSTCRVQAQAAAQCARPGGEACEVQESGRVLAPMHEGSVRGPASQQSSQLPSHTRDAARPKGGREGRASAVPHCETVIGIDCGCVSASCADAAAFGACALLPT